MAGALEMADVPSGEAEVVILDAQPLQSRPCPEEQSAPSVPARTPRVPSPPAPESPRREAEPSDHTEGATTRGPSPSEPARADVGTPGSPPEGPAGHDIPTSAEASALRSPSVCMDLVKQIRLPVDDQTLMGWDLGELVNNAYLGAVKVSCVPQ